MGGNKEGASCLIFHVYQQSVLPLVTYVSVTSVKNLVRLLWSHSRFLSAMYFRYVYRSHLSGYR